jgi:hypothetical protein
MKKNYYFQHDFGARNDDKIIALRIKHSWEGYGLFWAIIEKLWENGGRPLNFETIETMSYEFRCEPSLLVSIIRDFKLFEVDKEVFWSKSLSERLAKMLELQIKRAAAGSKGGKARAEKANLPDATSDDHYRVN